MLISINLDGTILTTSKELLIESINTLDKQKNIKGIEFIIYRIDEDIREYLLKFASLCKNYNYILNFHTANLDMDIKEHIKYLKLYDNISKILDKKINITYSSCLRIDLDQSISDSISNYVAIVGYVLDNKLNLNICAENLEYLNRPDFKIVVEDIVTKVYRLNLSYNIGHEALIGYNEYNIPNENNLPQEEIDNIINKIINISIHDNNLISAHLPFNYGNIDLYEVKNFINKYNYNKDITIELDLLKLSGKTIKEKIASYIAEVNKVKYMLR